MSECVDLYPKDEAIYAAEDAWSALSLQWFSLLAKAQLQGQTGLPYALGLDPKEYQHSLAAVDDEELFTLQQAWHSDAMASHRERAGVYQELLGFKLAERDELKDLLVEHAPSDKQCVKVMATVVATASLAPSHLWRSLGLQSRGELATLLSHHFPQLAAKNDKNMRWKRFFYRCLCEQGGDYLCRAPSCAECSTYQECFSPEE